MAGTWEEYQRARRRGKSSRAYRANRAICLAPNPLFCRLCGQRIDKRLHYTHPWSKTVDHIREVTNGGDPVALANMQPAHRWCNEEKERQRRARLEGRTARPIPRPGGLTTTEDWIVGESP